MKIKLKKLNKTNRKQHLDVSLLKNNSYAARFNIEIRNRFDALHIEEPEQQSDQEEHIEDIWRKVKESIITTTKGLLPFRTKRKKQAWMTDDILNMMDERKAYKNVDRNKYNQLNKEIINDCRKAKETWFNKQCEEIEELEKNHNSREMHAKVKDLWQNKKYNNSNGCIMDKGGNLLFDEKDVANRWKEYITELYDDNRADIPRFTMTTGNNILQEEVQKAISSMRKGKATGSDEISTEMLKALDDHNVKSITKLCNIIYNTGYIPTELEKSIFITIPKKAKAQVCSEFRTISLMSHVTKLLLKIIEQRLASKIDQECSNLQSGFRPGIGTREGIFNLRTILERAIEVQQDVYICFIDYTKAFDRVNYTKLIECLKEIGVDDKDLQIIIKMYWEQTAVVRTKNGVSSDFKIKKGVRQGCVLSPNLYNLYTEKIFREIEGMPGVVIGGVNMNNLRYADDTGLLATDSVKLQNLINTVNERGKDYGMSINIKKTKVMVVTKKKVTPNAKITIEGRAIEQVKKFIYLGHLITDNGKCDSEIKRRIEIARGAFNNISKVITSQKISISTRLRLIKCYVWSTLTYGAETWTISKTLAGRINAFEMWTYRKMLKLSYTKHKTNEEVLDMLSTEKQLLSNIVKRKCQYFGHLVRHNELQRQLLEGKINGKRSRGRPRITWMDNLKKWTGKSYGNLIRIAEDREKFRCMTFNVLKALDTL